MLSASRIAWKSETASVAVSSLRSNGPRIFRAHPVDESRAYRGPTIRRIHGLNTTNIPKLKRAGGLANHSRNSVVPWTKSNNAFEGEEGKRKSQISSLLRATLLRSKITSPLRRLQASPRVSWLMEHWLTRWLVVRFTSLVYNRVAIVLVVLSEVYRRNSTTL